MARKASKAISAERMFKSRYPQATIERRIVADADAVAVACLREAQKP